MPNDSQRITDKGVEWAAPSGFFVVHTESMKRRRRICEKPSLVVWEPVDPPKINMGKQASGIFPHFIHSLDAAHLAFTIKRLASEEPKLTHFGVVHDGYAVHACHADRLNQTLREEFISMYQNFDLSEFRSPTGWIVALIVSRHSCSWGFRCQ